MKITQDGTLDAEIKNRNIQGRRVIAIVNGILWDQSISNANKQKIYNAIFKRIS